MSRNEDIKFNVEREEEGQFYSFKLSIDAPVYSLVPLPKVSGGFLFLKEVAPDPPSRLKLFRSKVDLYFVFSKGIFQRNILPPENDHGYYGFIQNSNGNIDNVIPLGALSPFELVNGNDWDNLSPITVTYSKHPNTGKIADTAPIYWDIAAVNQINGERVVAIRTHASRNEVFRVLNRINQVVSYGRNVAETFSDVIGQKDKTVMKEIDSWCRANPLRFS